MTLEYGDNQGRLEPAIEATSTQEIQLKKSAQSDVTCFFVRSKVTSLKYVFKMLVGELLSE